MLDELKEAIRSRVAEGATKEDILEELAVAGYPTGIAEQLYTDLINEAVLQTSPIPPSQPAVQDLSTPTHHSTVERFLIGFGVFVLISMVSIGLLYLTNPALISQALTSANPFSGLFASQPYDTSGELFLGVVRSTVELEDQALSLSAEYDIEFLPKRTGEEVAVLPALAALASELEGSGVSSVPSEGHVKLQLAGVIDMTDDEDRKFDMTMSADLFLEPFILEAAASVRSVDGALYAKVDDMPAMFQSMYAAQVPAPLGEWFLVGTAAEMEAGTTNPFGVPQISSSAEPSVWLNAIPRSVELASQAQSAIAAVPLSLFGDMQSMLASAAAFRFKDDVDSQRLLGLMEQYPPLVFSESPTKEVVDGETFYRYEVTIDYENLVTLLEELPDTVTGARRAETAQSMQKIQNGLPAKEVLEELQNIATLYVDMSPRGQFRAMRATGAVSDSLTSSNKAEFSFVLGISPADSSDITAPSVTGSDSLLSEMVKRQTESRTKMMEATKQSTLIQ